MGYYSPYVIEDCVVVKDGRGYSRRHWLHRRLKRGEV